MADVLNINGDPTVGVSRKLKAEKAAFSTLYFQQQRPFAPAEVNLAQYALNESRRLLALGTSRPGFFLKSAFSTSGLNLIVPVDLAVVNGDVIRVESDTGNNISRALSDKPVSGSTWDIVFLEVWRQEVAATGTTDASSKNVYPNGWVDSPTDLAGDASYVLRDPLITSVPETSRRVQWRWRIRAFNTTDDPTTGDGMGSTGLAAQGGAVAPQLGYTFSAVSGALNTGLYRAGDGTLTAAGLLKDVAGYVWAIPIAVVVHADTDTAGVITGGQITDKRRNASPLANFGASGNNATIAGDDVIFYKLDGTTEMSRIIGTGISAGGNFKVRSASFESTIATGTAPFIVASTTKVNNLNVAQLDSKVPGNSNGNIPVSNGTVCTNLNAQYVNGITANANAADTLAIIGSDGKIPSAILPSIGSATTADFLVDTRPVTPVNRPAADFWLKSETVTYATAAGSASSASTATLAARATIANAIDNQANSATIPATTTNTANAIARRDGNGDFSARIITATLNGLASNSTLFDGAYLGMPNSYHVTVLGANGWGTANDTTNWSRPAMKGNSGGRLWNGWGRFPLRPTTFRKASGRVVTAKVFGGIMRPGLNAEGDPGAATYGFRIRTPSGAVAMSIERTLDPANSSTADSYYIEDWVAEFNLPLEDGIWYCEIRNSQAGTGAAGEYYNSDIIMIVSVL